MRATRNQSTQRFQSPARGFTEVHEVRGQIYGWRVLRAGSQISITRPDGIQFWSGDCGSATELISIFRYSRIIGPGTAAEVLTLVADVIGTFGPTGSRGARPTIGALLQLGLIVVVISVLIYLSFFAR